MVRDVQPPTTIYYAPGVAGKTGPFYVALRGIRSAMKTSTAVRNDQRWQEQGHGPGPDLRVWKGMVVWELLDIENLP